ncbi:MAG TPA: HD domain-containing protein [bacterium]
MNKKFFNKIFPEIVLIKSKKLRAGVIEAWILAAKKGKWNANNIRKVPFTLLTNTKKTLIQHTRSVTKMAMAVAGVRKDLDFDIVIAGGLIHDVGKLLEYEYSNRAYRKSEYGRLVRHPVSGYGLALEAGLPLAVAHIAAAHSDEGEKVTRSAEAILIHHCDFIDFDIERQK